MKKKLLLRLYVAGKAPNSLKAIANLRAIVAEHHPGTSIEIVDLLEKPAQALADGILVTPTLVRLSPPPLLRVIGNLSETSQVLLALTA